MNYLSEMTDDVAELVLADNYGPVQCHQCSCLSRAPGDPPARTPNSQQLEKYSGLDRQIENLPNDETLANRISNGEGLYRPELAVLMAYNKMTMFQALLNSDVPEDSFSILGARKILSYHS